jgi:hypothetical protein
MILRNSSGDTIESRFINVQRPIRSFIVLPERKSVCANRPDLLAMIAVTARSSKSRNANHGRPSMPRKKNSKRSCHVGKILRHVRLRSAE